MTNQDDDLLDREIAGLLRRDCDEARRAARVPPPEVVWLRATMRAREEAARKALRPIIVGEAIGVAAFAGLLVSLVAELPMSQLFQVPLTLAALVIGSWLVLAPVALYLAFSRD
jgi:hypothetical protein